MTREEALNIVNNGPVHWADWFVDALVNLGVLKLDQPKDEVKLAAIEQLTGCFVELQDHEGNKSGARRLHIEGSIEIVDVLAKSGFKIIK